MTLPIPDNKYKDTTARGGSVSKRSRYDSSSFRIRKRNKFFLTPQELEEEKKHKNALLDEA